MKLFVAHKDNPNRASRVGNAFRRSVMNSGYQLTADPMAADIAVMYGMAPGHVAICRERKLKGKPSAFFDLGYWNRQLTLGNETCYRLAVNYWHPQHYIPLIDEKQKFNRPIMPRYTGGSKILVVGMGLKSYNLYNRPPREWDNWVIGEIRKHTNREIIYYPKASDNGAPLIKGTIHHAPGRTLEDDPIWKDVWCVVTHHSNNAVEALRLGIPALAWDGAATVMCSNDLSTISSPVLPDGVADFLNRVAYCQWSVNEINTGDCLRWLIKMVPKIPMDVELRENV